MFQILCKGRSNAGCIFVLHVGIRDHSDPGDDNCPGQVLQAAPVANCTVPTELPVLILNLRVTTFRASTHQP